MVHYTEGSVTLNDKPFTRKLTEFPQLKAGEDLRTEDGRAEILLSPGVFLRVAENSGIRMLNNSILETRLELIAGSALLELGDLAKEQSLEVTVGSRAVNFTRKGLFRLDFDPERLRVYDGSAIVPTPDGLVTVKEGRQAELAGVINPVKFDKEDTDSFYRWASRRSGYISMANVAAARRVHDSGSSFTSSSWVYNPLFGMFTYLPLSGSYRNPFGYSYYSPYSVMNAYYRPAPAIWNSGGLAGASSSMMGASAVRGMGGMQTGSMGRGSGTVSAGGSMAAPSAPSGGAVSSGGARSGGGGGASRGGGGHR